VNLKAEREVETILMHLENQNQLILHILERLDQRDQQAEPSAPGEQGWRYNGPRNLDTERG
jgi:hypothetical protein